MDLVRVHGHDGFFRGKMLGTAIAEAFGTGFDGADTEGFMSVRLEGVVRDMGVIKLQARQLRQMANCSGTPCTVSLLVGHRFIIRDDPRGRHKK